MTRFKSKWARYGSKGGKAKGHKKRRAPDHYKRIAQLGVAARQAQARTSHQKTESGLP